METWKSMENFKAQTKKFHMYMQNLKGWKKVHPLVWDIYDYFLQCVDLLEPVERVDSFWFQTNGEIGERA